MVSMCVMQVTFDQVVHMITVRYRLVPASLTVFMFGVMPGAIMIRGASDRVHIADRDEVVLDRRVCVVMHLAIVEIVEMVAVAHC